MRQYIYYRPLTSCSYLPLHSRSIRPFTPTASFRIVSLLSLYRLGVACTMYLLGPSSNRLNSLLQVYYDKGTLDLGHTTHLFFDILYQKMFQVKNSIHILNCNYYGIILEFPPSLKRGKREFRWAGGGRKAGRALARLPKLSDGFQRTKENKIPGGSPKLSFYLCIKILQSLMP